MKLNPSRQLIKATDRLVLLAKSQEDAEAAMQATFIGRPEEGTSDLVVADASALDNTDCIPVYDGNPVSPLLPTLMVIQERWRARASMPMTCHVSQWRRFRDSRHKAYPHLILSWLISPSEDHSVFEFRAYGLQ